jgi:hypothetical protein
MGTVNILHAAIDKCRSFQKMYFFTNVDILLIYCNLIIYVSEKTKIYIMVIFYFILFSSSMKTFLNGPFSSLWYIAKQIQ